MTQDEACDILMWALYDREIAEAPAIGRCDLNEVLARRGCDDRRVVGRAAQYLQSRGMFVGYAAGLDCDYSADISSAAVRMMEKLPHGVGVMERLHPPTLAVALKRATQDDACDLILWAMFDEELANPGSGIVDITSAVAARGLTDVRQLERAVDSLNDRGLLTDFAGCDEADYIGNRSARAVRMMEILPHGASLMAALHAPKVQAQPTNIYHGPVIQGGVSNSIVAIGSPDSKQTLTTGSPGE